MSWCKEGFPERANLEVERLCCDLEGGEPMHDELSEYQARNHRKWRTVATIPFNHDIIQIWKGYRMPASIPPL